MDRRILLHICCGPCGTSVVERLRSEGRVTLFFSNANIWPGAEYARRLQAAKDLAARCGCDLVEDAYDHAAWLLAMRGLEDEPEKGRRCLRCFAYSLARAASHAEEHGYTDLTTTLTVSGHKRSTDILRIGGEASLRFLAIDFKKKDGFRRSIALAKEYGLYRQQYCGCEFSLRDRVRRSLAPRPQGLSRPRQRAAGPGGTGTPAPTPSGG